MVQPQIGLSAGGPSTLGSFRVKMRFGPGAVHAVKQLVNIRINEVATLRKMVRHTNDQTGSSTPRSRCRFRKRFFRVTTLAALISDPGR